MRYQNWDVLLFPGHSRVPIQEFNTACHVLFDQGKPLDLGQLAASRWAPPDDPFVTIYESMSKTPILTCFVSSLAAGTPFRISIHSWERPSPSTILKSRKAEEEPIAFQARVYVDGKVQTKRLFREGNIWPEVIEAKDGRYQEPDADLTFPAFHPEILQQPRWDPGEQLGRVQIVLTEGVLRETTDLQTGTRKVAFDGLRDVIAFSFQHAPQDILEYSGIAWPNSRLFESRGASARRQPPLGSRTPSLPGYEAHSHSPHRSVSNREDVWARIANKADLSFKDYAYRTSHTTSSRFVGPQTVASTSNALSGFNDPFIAPGPESSLGWRSATRKISTDESMPDYVSHGTDTSRADTDMSVHWPRRDFQRHMDEAAVEEIVQALSPTKKGQLLNALSPNKTSSSGVQPPVNTPTTDLKQVGSQEATPRDRLSGATAGNSGQGGVAVRSESDVISKVGGTRGMTTRSMNLGAGDVAGELDLLQHRRGRSSSGSSKRKRSLSPFTAEAKRRLKLNLTPPALIQNKKRSPLLIDESSSESESANSLVDTEDRESSTTSKGVSLDI